MSSLNNAIADAYKETGLELLFPKENSTKEEVFYRRNGISVDKIVEFDNKTGAKVKTTHYDYFDDKKIRSVDEFDRQSGKKIRTINYVLYKSVDEYDLETGKKKRTINYSVKDETKISSIQEYDIESGKITAILIYKRDGKTISIIKKINPHTGKVINYINKCQYKTPVIPCDTRIISYDNIQESDRQENETIENLIDNLYNKQTEIGSLKVS